MNTKIVKSKQLQKNDLELINKFALNKLNESDIFTFSVALCTNEIDRDFESFTKTSIEKLAKMFIGKTGIFDHRPNAANQSARIYKTQVKTTNELTSFGEPKVVLEADAYMVKCDEFENLIKKINAGILKEVSISCKVDRKICSICNQTFNEGCNHQPGKIYGEKKCFLKLLDPVDAYEWSFVPIPAQLGAQTIKQFSISQKNNLLHNAQLSKELKLDLEKQVLKLGFLCGFYDNSCQNSVLPSLIEKMNFKDLAILKKEFENMLAKNNFQNNLFSKNLSKTATPKKETFSPYLI